MFVDIQENVDESKLFPIWLKSVKDIVMDKVKRKEYLDNVRGGSELFSFLEIVRFNWDWHTNDPCWEIFKNTLYSHHALCVLSVVSLS